ncbi:MAG: hypothetical protein LQ350_005713 [Teloschistes chrysophthalmus]|nr:MAG: hypothetical protein LQ350_005713 [Niorma chrysophthalma]
MGSSPPSVLGPPPSYEEACIDGYTPEAKSSSAQQKPFPHPESPFSAATNSQNPPNRNVTVEPIDYHTLPYFRRIIGLLLPIRYPDKFFAESVQTTSNSSLARAAIWRDIPRRGGVQDEKVSPNPRTSEPPKFKEPSNNSSLGPHDGDPGTVIGGIQCRIEYRLCDPSAPFDPATVSHLKPRPAPQVQETKYCYIQTLALLSPYRSKGIATMLLESILATLCREPMYYGTKIIYAHVWEMNEEALEWYKKRGFTVCEELVRDYYRRLRPAGARLVWRELGVGDHLRANGDGVWGFPKRQDDELERNEDWMG